MSTMSDHQKVTVLPTEKIPFDQLPLPSKVGGPLEFTNLSIVQTVTTVSIVTVSSESPIVSAGSVPPEVTTLPSEGIVPPKVTTESIVSVPQEVSAASAENFPLNTIESTDSVPLEVNSESIESVPLEVTTLPPDGTVPPKVTTESTVSDPLEVSAAATKSVSLNTIESTESAPPKVTSESVDSVPPEVTTLPPPEGTVPPKVTTESIVSVPLEISAAYTESVPLNTVESTESVHSEVTSESIESVPREETILPSVGIVSPKVTTGSTVSVPLEIFATSTESVPLNTVTSTKSVPPEVSSNSLDCIPPEVTTGSTMSVPLEVSAASIESVPLNTVELTESAPPEVTSVATESVPPNATTLPLTSVTRESIVESTKSVHLEVTSESTGSGSSEVTTKPTEGVIPQDVTNSSIASAPSSNPPQLTPTPNVSALSPGLTVAASSLTSGTPDGQELITKARDDAIHLNRAFAGWRPCDEATIVKILAQRSARQRTLIRQEYKTKFSEDFDNRLSKELLLKRDLKRALLLWMDEPVHRDAKIVKHGLSKNVAIEVICSRTPSQLEELKRAYRILFGVYLDEDIESHAHGDNKKLLVEYAGTTRSESLEVDAVKVDNDAKDLFKDGEWRLGTNEETFIRIFSERSGAHLAAINSAYRKMYVTSLKKAVKKETSWKFKCALLTILQCAENPGKYFAKALHKAMKGLGTDDETLTRIIVSRAEVDIEKIKAEYLKKYRKSLSDDVHEDTSGQYRAFLISLLNPNA